MDAQEVARLDFIAHKGRTKYTESHTYDIPRMRNAWVAYHAGAPWMGHPVSVGSLILQTTRENARLRAEVERLRSGIEAKRRALQDRMVLHDGCDPSAARECRIAIAALDALTREDSGSDA